MDRILTMPQGEAILRTKAEPFTGPFEHLEHLAHVMGRLMHRGKGIGLAGPQIGVSKRLIVVAGSIVFGKEKTDPDTLLLVNPKVTRHGRTSDLQIEGCLSLPGQFGLVHRPESCQVEFQNHQGHHRRIDCKGLLARCLQHEIDHLDGILISDQWIQEVCPRG